MKTTYNRLAGNSVERLAALSDGIFGVAMTLLLLDLQLPSVAGIHSEADLGRAIVSTLPRLLLYLLSFLTLGIFWIGQQAQLNHLERSDHHLTWIHLSFLFLVTLLPVSTKFLAAFITYRLALLTYWFIIFLLGAVLYGSWGWAIREKRVKDEVTPVIAAAICRRIQIAQLLLAVGAALCVINTYVSIGFIVLVQLSYTVAPEFLNHLEASVTEAEE